VIVSVDVEKGGIDEGAGAVIAEGSLEPPARREKSDVDLQATAGGIGRGSHLKPISEACDKDAGGAGGGGGSRGSIRPGGSGKIISVTFGLPAADSRHIGNCRGGAEPVIETGGAGKTPMGPILSAFVGKIELGTRKGGGDHHCSPARDDKDFNISRHETASLVVGCARGEQVTAGGDVAPTQTVWRGGELAEFGAIAEELDVGDGAILVGSLSLDRQIGGKDKSGAGDRIRDADPWRMVSGVEGGGLQSHIADALIVKGVAEKSDMEEFARGRRRITESVPGGGAVAGVIHGKIGKHWGRKIAQISQEPSTRGKRADKDFQEVGGDPGRRLDVETVILAEDIDAGWSVRGAGGWGAVRP